MKLRFEDVAACGEITDLPAEALSPEAEARITAMTMKQIAPKRRKPLRYIAAAAAVIAALGITTFAAAERGWFGFDRFFGGSTEAVAEHVRNYGETEEAVTGRQAEAAVAPYVRTPEQERGIAEGYLFMPDSARVDPATATAVTDNYTYTLESMLASPDTLLAVVKVDAKTDEAAEYVKEMGLLNAVLQIAAERIRSVLAENHGIPAEVMIFTSAGDTGMTEGAKVLAEEIRKGRL